MIYKKIPSRVVLFTIGILITHRIYTIPIEYQRLLQLDREGKVIRTIDLISDQHSASLDFVKKASKHTKKKLLSVDEKRKYTVAERTLLNTLREMAYGPKRPPIILLWEISHDRLEGEKKISGETPYTAFGKFLFLNDAGERLKLEFNQASTSNIQVVDTDSYRKDNFDLIFSVNPSTVLKNYRLQRLVKPLFDLLNPQSITTILNHIRKYNDDTTYKKLASFWNNYLATILKPFILEYINPFLKKTPSITVQQFKSSVTAKISLEELEQLYFMVTDPIFELETILNIFARPEKHTIVYAGADHIDNIKEILLKHFGFITALDVGAKNTVTNREYPQLSPSAWKLLKNTPETTLLSYKQKGAHIKKVDEEFWREIHDILSEEEETELSLSELERWIKTGFNHYLNSPNTRLEHKKPLLIIAIEKDLVNTVALLLKYGAVANAYYLDLDQLEYISAFNIALKKKNPAIIQLLKQYGIQEDIKIK